MVLDPKNTAETARRYLGIETSPTRLGAGIGGYVYLSPDLTTAVKVHNHEDGFQRELFVYRRLRSLRITKLHGLTVPKLHNADQSLMLIQMDFVSAPFLLDFAGVLLESPYRAFDAERLQHWHDSISGFFGPNAHIAYAIYNTLSQYGLYYVDFRPSNLNLSGLPGLEPYDPNVEE